MIENVSECVTLLLLNCFSLHVSYIILSFVLAKYVLPAEQFDVLKLLLNNKLVSFFLPLLYMNNS